MSSYSSQYSSAVRRKEAAATARPKPRGRPAELTLSAALAQAPSAFDGKRITAVDKNIVAIDALPERVASQVKTLYLSKNGLASLEGVQQFSGLRALSTADNRLADLAAVLGPLRSAGLQLEAANFEGNPIAELPNYRAHVLEALGPSLSMLDNRPVGPEERGAAASAVAHEATMLALMLSNACLVHKLGRAVQLVRLHCELKCAVLGGQCGTQGAPAGGSGGGEPAGGDVSRLLQLWDYESGLNRQERQAVLLAIRREVGRRYKRMLLAGAKLDGSAKSWQQAFAQVMLSQQETVASLMRLLEEARAEAAAVLAPLMRPASPMKLRALRSEQEADCRVKRDREALIMELRDAFLGLADGSGHSSPRHAAAQYEQRIRELHAALQASSSSSTEHVAAPGSEWSIPAERGDAATGGGEAGPLPEPTASPRRQALARPKSALKQPGRSPARMGSKPRDAAAEGGGPGVQPSPRSPRPASAPAARPSSISRPRPPSAAQSSRTALLGGPEPEGLQVAQLASCTELVAQPVGWRGAQLDGGAAKLEEEHREATPVPTPFPPTSCSPDSRGGDAGSAERPRAASPRGDQAASLPHPASRSLAPHMDRAAAAAAVNAAQQAASWLPAAGSAPSMPGQRVSSRPASPASHCRAASPRPCSPSAWTANPLAKAETLSKRPGSPALQNLLGMLAYEGEQKQLAVLQQTLADMESANARLQDANTELADSLQQLHQHAQRLEAQLARQREEFAGREAALAAEAAGAKQGREEMEAEVVMLRMDRQDFEEQLARSRADGLAGEAEAQALRRKVQELEGRDPVKLTLTVSFEAELTAEMAKSAALEARCSQLEAELAARLAAQQRQEQLQLACDMLGGKSCLRRMFQRWRTAAAERVSTARLYHLAAASHQDQQLRKWLQRWRLAVQRTRMLAAREQQREVALVRRAWAAWRQQCHDAHLHRALEAAAQLHRQAAVLRVIVRAWRAHAAGQRQVDWPEDHPTMVKAGQLRQARLMASVFKVWRGWLVEFVRPKLARLSLVKGHFFMGTQRRAWLAWREYLAHRRHRALLKAVADQQLLSKHLLQWQRWAAEEKVERSEALRGAISNKVLLLRRAWRGWWEFVRAQHAEEAAAAAARSHRRKVVLRSAWQCWQQWVQLSTELKDRQRARLLKATLRRLRSAAKAAEQRRCAAEFHGRRVGLRWQLAFKAWRQVVEGKQLRLQRLAHAQEVLQRWRLGRALATWRRGVLVSKLSRSLELVQQLQAAISNVRQELERKAGEIESLESIKLTVTTHAESLSLRVTSLDSELLAAEQRAAELQTALQRAQEEHSAACTARNEALAARDAAAAERGQACSERDAALAGRDAALAGQTAAEQRAGAAERARETAAQAALQAEQAAAAAAAERDGMAAQAAAAAAEAQRLGEVRAGLARDLEAAQAEAARLAGCLEEQQAAAARLQREQECARAEARLAEAERQAAAKQAERLAAMCEDRERQCRQLQEAVADLEGQLSRLQLLDGELQHLAQRSDALHEENKAQRVQLAAMAAAAEAAEGERARLQSSLEAMRVGEVKLLAAVEEQQKQRQGLASLLESVQQAKGLVEGQLKRSQGVAEQLAGDKQALAQALARLQAERDGLVQSAERLGAEMRGLEAQAGKLREQLQQSNGMLASCRELLAGCLPGGRGEGLPLEQLLGCVKAELHERDAAIRALAQDNRQRSGRVQALQAQVDQLSRHALAGASADALRVPEGAPDRQAAPSHAIPLPRPSASAGGPPSSSYPAAPPPAASSFGGAECGAAGAPALPPSPAASVANMRSFSPGAAQHSGAYSPANSLAGSAARAADAINISSPSPAGPAASDPATPYFSSSFGVLPTANPASSVPSSFLHLRVTASTGAAMPTASGRPGAPASLAGDGSQRGSPAGPAAGNAAPGISPLAAATASLNSLLASHATAGTPSPSRGSRGSSSSVMCSDLHAAGAPPGSPGVPSGEGAGAAEQLRQLLARRGLGRECGAEAALGLPPEVSEERLGFLLELVVQKRISAAEAQQVIQAAGDGDARPLLRVLDGVKRKLQGGSPSRADKLPEHPHASPQRSPGHSGAPVDQQKQPLPQGMSPGSATELAAVRRQIQLLQASIPSTQP